MSDHKRYKRNVKFIGQWEGGSDQNFQIYRVTWQKKFNKKRLLFIDLKEKNWWKGCTLFLGSWKSNFEKTINLIIEEQILEYAGRRSNSKRKKMTLYSNSFHINL